MLVKASELIEGDEVYGNVNVEDDAPTMTVKEVMVSKSGQSARILFKNGFIAEYQGPADEIHKIRRVEVGEPVPA